MADAAGGAGELRVETDTLASTSDELQTIADGLRDELRRLISNTESVVEGSWRGEAATAFAREWEEFRSAAESIVEDADVIAGLVALSAKQYSGTDEASAQMLRATWSRVM
ncbi:WXG100 family type VII secretion target [Mycobacterium sp. DSM 3803]|nr:WXG100 family type VII secretion target [Mycobacterium sp. DSM 3803]